MAKGSGYKSSNGVETTQSPMQEIVPTAPKQWTIGLKFKKLSFINETACTLIINNKDTIRIEAGRGLEIGYDDVPIHSLVIVEQGTSYEFMGAY